MSRRPIMLLPLIVGLAVLTGPVGHADPGATRPGVVEPGLLGSPGRVEVLARFRTVVPRLPSGTLVRYRFASMPAVYATVDAAALRALARLDGLMYLERPKPIAFDLDLATVASRARTVWAPTATTQPIRVGGAVVDGSGVGIAIVDTGLDGLHPDFQTPGKVGGNYTVTPDGVHAAPYTVSGSAHGTHVAGIAAGNGAASGGKYRGAAPGASVYAFGVAPGGTTAFPAIAFDWILTNGAQQVPPIEVVNNSWHCIADATCGGLNGDALHVALASRLAESGVTITWSAGNDGGDGFLPETNLEAINPTPGIISVANYDDDGRGLRGLCVMASSSRGAAVQPETWPDIAAPGRDVTSTWAMGPTTSPVQDTQYTRTPDGRNTYRQSSGTSMAAPHVAGIVALMRQANPTLTPAQIEYLLKASAEKLECTIRGGEPDPWSEDPTRRDPFPYVNADPQHTYDGARFFDGHGLVDARAAVEAAIAFSGTVPPMPPAEPLPDEYRAIRASVDAERTLYLREPDTLSTSAPTKQAGARVFLGDEPVTSLSEPLAPHATDALEVELWIGTDAEYHATYLGRPTTVHTEVTGLQMTIERIGADGASETLVQRESLLRLASPGVPVYRRWVLPLAEVHAFAAGDRLRLTLNLRSDLTAVDQPKVAWVLYSDAALTPSSVSLGRKVTPVVPGTSRECKIRVDCAEIGGARTLTAFECNVEHTLPNHPRIKVRWTGPPGSSGVARCQGYVAICTIPGEPATDPWGTCVAEASVVEAYDSYDTACFYLTRDGMAVAGNGRCEQTPASREIQS